MVFLCQVVILEASAKIVRSLKKDIGCEKATSKKPRPQVPEVAKQVETLDLLSFEA